MNFIKVALIAAVLFNVSTMIISTGDSVIDNSNEQLNTTNVMLFNQKFEQFEGETVKGSSVKTLLSNISDNNTDNTQQAKVKVRSNLLEKEILTQEEITVFKQQISTADTYKVTVEHGTNKLVNTVIIETTSR